jgi:hypothetical protein
MKCAWIVSALTASYCSLCLGNIFTNDTDYEASLDVQRSQIDATNSTLIGATWVLEKPIGLFYGVGIRVLASPVDGFSESAREKSLSLFFGGPVIGWNVSFHPFVGLRK